MEASEDAGLRLLLEEIAAYPDPEGARDRDSARTDGDILGPLMVRAPDGSELSFLGMFATSTPRSR